MYLLGYQAMIYVGSIVVAPPAGYYYDRIGFAHTYLIMGGIALLFTLISTLTLSACHSRRDEKFNMNSVTTPDINASAPLTTVKR